MDAYDLLLHGVRSDLKRLQNGDTFLVPPLGPLATVEGMVRRPAVYELPNETSLAEVLELAGGILPTAALRHIEVQRIEAHEKRTMLTLDLTRVPIPKRSQAAVRALKFHDGDQVHIFPIASYNEDAIYLQGHVLRPGRYSYKTGMRLTDLISSYGDLLPEPAPHYAEIMRLNPPDFHPTVESFDISAALANPASTPTLKPLDTVRIFSRYDFELHPKCGWGAKCAGLASTARRVKLIFRDAIHLAGGVTPDASLESAQLFRQEARRHDEDSSVDLQRGTRRKSCRQHRPAVPRQTTGSSESCESGTPTVNIRGEVAKPGRYPFAENMRVEDLVRVTGGLKRSA